MALPAVIHFDPVIGIDVHVVMAPATPVPLPHPHVGFVYDLAEYIDAAVEMVMSAFIMPLIEEDIAPIMQAISENSLVVAAGGAAKKAQELAGSVGGQFAMQGGGLPILINGLMRATAGTQTRHVPGLHFPLGTSFTGPDARIPSQDSESFMGSRTVLANNDPASFALLPALSCSFVGMMAPPKTGPHTKRRYQSLPTSLMMPIPLGRPVLIGGPPVFNMMAVAKGLFRRFQGSKWARNLADALHLPPGKIRCALLKAEPVHVITGEVIVQQNDFTVEGRLPLVWDRYYASHTAFSGAAGLAWQTPADIRLECLQHAGQLAAVAYFHDHATAFDSVPSREGWDSRVHESWYSHALFIQDNKFTIRTKDSLEYRFLIPAGWRRDGASITLQLSEIGDLNGNLWRIDRRADGSPLRLIECAAENPTGRVIQCEPGSNAGQLGRIVLRDAENEVHQLVRYEQDADRNLVAVHDALGQPYRFEYAGGRHMVRHTDRNGLSFYYSHVRHDDDVWRVDHAWGDGGLFDYRFVYDLDYLETRFTNSLGDTSVMQYNERGLPVAEIDALGGITSYQYDGQHRTIAEIDAAGNRSEWAYDDHGNLLTHTLPDRSVVMTSYDANHLPLQVTDPEGGKWHQSWDARGNLRAQTTPSGASTQFEYDTLGQLVHVTNPAGQGTALMYDAMGFIACVRDALGHQTRFQHDSRGNVLRKEGANGDTTGYVYDAKNRLAECLLPGGGRVACRYDPEDNLTRYIDEAGRETRFEYYGQGNIKTRIDADGTRVAYRYDTEEQLIGVENQHGKTWHLKRDAAGRLIEEIDYWGQSRRYEYDLGGHLQRTVDPLGQTLALTSDALGRITGKRADEVESETYRYNRRGQLIEARNRFSSVERGYNADGQLLSERQKQSQMQATLDYLYDPSGRLVEQKRAFISAQDTVPGLTHTLRYSYDVLGQLATQQIDDHEPMRFTHDVLGRLSGHQMTPGLAHQYRYNAAGQLARHETLRHGRADSHTDYHYDAAGNLTRREDSARGSETYRYDPLGQIVRRAAPDGKVSEFVYDRFGDRFTQQSTDAHGRTLEHRDGTVYRLDLAGQLIERRDAARRHLRLEWNAFGRLRGVVNHAGEKFEYVYDALGRRVCKIYRAQASLAGSVAETRTWFMWDGDAMVGEVRQIVDEKRARARWLESKDAWAAEQDGARGERVACEGRFYVYRLGSFEPMVMQVHSALFPGSESEVVGPARLYYYQNDPNGMPLRLRDSDGEIVWDAYYSVFGAVERFAVEQVEQPLRLQGQYFDGESGLSYNRYRYYDPNTGSFISQDLIGLEGGLNPYQFAPNVFGWTDPLGLAKKKGGGCDLRKMTADELEEFFENPNWHQTNAKRKLINEFRNELRGDTNVDLMLERSTREVFLQGNKSKVTVSTGRHLE